MAELNQAEKLNAVIKELMRTKITSDFSNATKIAETLIADDSKLSEGEKYFKQVIFHKVTDDFIKWFTGDKLGHEMQRLQSEIDGLRKELAEVRKIAVQGAARGTPEQQPHAGSSESTGQQGQQPQAQPQQGSGNPAPQQKPASSSPAAQASNPNTGRAKRDEMKPEEYDISKVFYFGNKK